MRRARRTRRCTWP
uniref:Uncharacterized protein n=1 Tax=Arundo donax TaxID=35708 RepID=A0A0A9HK22_ARUDO